MFPPPQPWKQLVGADPDRTYLAFTSRFSLRSPLRLPAFIASSLRIMRQVEAAPGCVGYSLGANLLTLQFYTLSAWEDDAHLRAFSRATQHGTALRAFHSDMRAPSPFIHWPVLGKDLPLRWADALARIRQDDATRAAGRAPGGPSN